jgi:hypothetical protein
MVRRMLNYLALVTLSAGVLFLSSNAVAGNLPGDSVKVLPRVSNPISAPSRPVSSDIRSESHRPGRVSAPNDANAGRDQSQRTTRRRADDTSEARNQRDDEVCTEGDPKLIGLHCSKSSQCDWGARCAGLPARCANTGAPCASSIECTVAGVCSAGSRRVSNRGEHMPARTPPAPHSNGSQIPSAASGARAVNHGVVSR